jgi:hypothetical protein
LFTFFKVCCSIDKHSSLLQKFVNYGCKMFYNIQTSKPRSLRVSLASRPGFNARKAGTNGSCKYGEV